MIERGVLGQWGAAEDRLDDVEGLARMGGAEVQGELDLGAPAIRLAAVSGVDPRVQLRPFAGRNIPDLGKRVSMPCGGDRRWTCSIDPHVRLARENHHDARARRRRWRRGRAAGGQGGQGETARRDVVELDHVVGPLRARAGPVVVEQQLCPARPVVQETHVVVGHRIGTRVARRLKQGRDVQPVRADRKVGDPIGRPGLLAEDEPVGARTAGEDISALARIDRVVAGAARQRRVRAGGGQHHPTRRRRGRRAAVIVLDHPAGRSVLQTDARAGGTGQGDHEDVVGLDSGVAEHIDRERLADLAGRETEHAGGHGATLEVNAVSRVNACS